MADHRKHIEVLAMIPEGEGKVEILKPAKADISVTAVATLEEGKALLERQGARYRIVLADTMMARDVTAGIVEVSPRFPWIAFGLFVNAETERKEGKTAANAEELQDLLARSGANVHHYRLFDPRRDQWTREGELKEVLDKCVELLDGLPPPP